MEQPIKREKCCDWWAYQQKPWSSWSNLVIKKGQKKILIEPIDLWLWEYWSLTGYGTDLTVFRLEDRSA